jgi:1,4-dihydroxy-2-naphthoate octaprenyltransferase
VGVVTYGWPVATLGALAALVMAIGPLRLVLSDADARELIPALGGTARVVALYGAVLALGLGLG